MAIIDTLDRFLKSRKRRSRWGPVLARFQDALPETLTRAQDVVNDVNGSRAVFLAADYRTIAVCKYILEGDVESFRGNLGEAAEIQIRLLQRYNEGELGVGDYASMLTYRDLLDVLASGNFSKASRLAELMGGRPEIEAKLDSLFSLSFGYSLKYLVLNQDENARQWAPRLAKACAQQRFAKNFWGYPKVHGEILEGSTSKASQALLEVLDGHQRESRGSGSFRETVDQELCVWGVGMANLCRWRGLQVKGIPPLIPSDLLI